MSEVKRYHWAGDHSDGIGYGCMYDSVESGTKEMIGAEDFDRVTAERDAALEELCARAGTIGRLTGERAALQQRLTAAAEQDDRNNRVLKIAADEVLSLEKRVGVLVGLLRDVSESVTGRQGTFARIPADWFDRRDAALKPAEVSDESCEFCKGWGFRANSETGADEGCGACNGTGSTPSEDQP